MTVKAISVLRSATANEPSRAFSSRTYSSTPSRCRVSGRLSSSTTTARTTNISPQIGSAMSTQSRKEIRSPVASSISPRPIRLGGEPTGVSRPPTLAP